MKLASPWPIPTRPPWDHYFMAFALAASERATCKRLKVGAVIVVDKQVVATGYNGSPPGLPHCIDGECDVEDNHCVRTIHAEMNAIIQAAKHGVSISGATIYTTATPCWNCFRVLLGAGIKRYVYQMDYRFEGANANRIQCASNTQGVALDKLTRCYRCNDTGEVGPYDDLYQCVWCPAAAKGK